jgi:hypothetical protein
MPEPFDSRSAALRLRQSREVVATHRREADIRELAQQAARAVADHPVARVPLSDQRGPRFGIALAGILHPFAHEALEVVIFGHDGSRGVTRPPATRHCWIADVPGPDVFLPSHRLRSWGPLERCSASGRASTDVTPSGDTLTT